MNFVESIEIVNNNDWSEGNSHPKRLGAADYGDSSGRSVAAARWEISSVGSRFRKFRGTFNTTVGIANLTDQVNQVSCKGSVYKNMQLTHAVST